MNPIVNGFNVRRQIVFVLTDRFDCVVILFRSLMCLAKSSTFPIVAVPKIVFDKSPISGKIESAVLDFNTV